MADVTINNLSDITPATGLFLPASNSTTNTTGKVTLSQVCGVMTSSQITTALGYTPYNSSNPAGYITSSSLPASQQLPRAWVSFNGFNNTSNINSITNTNRFIRSSYNVSSVLRNGLGDYTINFSPALPDTNYMTLFGKSRQNGNNSCHPYIVYVNGSPLLKSADQLRIYNSRAFADNVEDSFEINVMVFR